MIIIVFQVRVNGLDIPYINANIEFGNKLKKVIELLKAENGKWKIKDEIVVFEKSDCQRIYEETLFDGAKNEEEIAELYDKLFEVM